MTERRVPKRIILSLIFQKELKKYCMSLLCDKKGNRVLCENY